MKEWGKCDNCGKEDVPLYDGLCIECASKRPKQGSEDAGYKRICSP